MEEYVQRTILLVVVNSKGAEAVDLGVLICCPVAILILCEACVAMGGRVSTKEARQLWWWGSWTHLGGCGISNPQMGRQYSSR